MSELRDKLKSELETTDWLALEPHHGREALMIVHQDLDLLDVAVSVAQDNAEDIKKWMSEKKLQRPTEEQVETWKDLREKKYIFIIVQPFVFVQEVLN